MGKFFIKNYLIFGVVVVAMLSGGAYWYVKTNEAPSFTAFAIGRGNVIESVDQSGNIIAENNVNLSFQEAGQIAEVNVREGEYVAAGAPLASLDSSLLKTALSQANAALAAAEAKLDGLTSGTRPEQLQIDIAAVASAKASLGAVLQSAYATADDAVRNQIDNMFSTPENNPTFLIPYSDSQAVTNIQAKRQVVGNAVKNWYSATTATTIDLLTLASIADKAMAQVRDYLNLVAVAVNQAIASSVMPASTLAQYKLNVSTARAEVNGSISSLATAEAALVNAQDKLSLDEAGATPQDIETQKAVVAQAQAAAASAQVAIDHAVLTAPFAGTVQNLTAKVGQVVMLGAQVFSLVNNGGLKIEVYVSQADVAKIKEGEKANVTADAYGVGTIFPASVTTVGATKTTVNGTSAYKVTLHFMNADERLKDGMTANVHIVASEHDNVLELPSHLIITENSDKFVLVKNGSLSERHKIETGITGNDGMTEVTSGLNEGEQVVNF